MSGATNIPEEVGIVPAQGTLDMRGMRASREVFVHEVAATINRLSLENFSDTPDFVLARYLWECLATYGEIVKMKDAHRG